MYGVCRAVEQQSILAIKTRNSRVDLSLVDEGLNVCGVRKVTYIRRTIIAREV
jgi:hypothetical protein